ncbi:hypothetical protein F383_08619 [Gossypium arboreum]|uniref:Uncharacterized protein n=1 Tax=Gossypium arboreum TaxID=29729 RepID=A0A0B0P5E4_GOSAR|nr:hypothetical protein F383_08619 [Gossypium arboreum]
MVRAECMNVYEIWNIFGSIEI